MSFLETIADRLAALYKPLYMSAVISPDGDVMTRQHPSERYTSQTKQQVQQLPPVIRQKTHKNLITSDYVAKVLEDYLSSEEGKELVTHLRKHGRWGRRQKAGSIDDLIVINAGERMVAATMPESVRSNLIINADFYDTYARRMAAETGLSYKEAIEGVIAHELHHYYGQSQSELRQPTPIVEFKNDAALVKFYVGLAGKHPEHAEHYFKKARLFTKRYGGVPRAAMDLYINFYEKRMQQQAPQGVLVPRAVPA